MPPPPQVGRKRYKSAAGFTLVEIMIAVSIFSVISTIVADLYIQAFRESAKANNQNEVYEDARYIMQEIGNEIRAGAIDYDEYYNRNMVNKSTAPGKSAPFGERNYGQNFGRYYSAFFNPGTITKSDGIVEDDGLGFLCNNGERNKTDCTPLRKTIDRNTGSNPFSGKYGDSTVEENAFCGLISYKTDIDPSPDTRVGDCATNSLHGQDELYLISADSFQKTILARELTSNPNAPEKTYALSILRLKGIDTGNDGIPDKFVCTNDFNCTGEDLRPYGKLPLLDKPDLDPPLVGDLNQGNRDPDPKENGFANDFVPISSLRVNVLYLKFYISPSDDPHYAFAEGSSYEQPTVTIFLTVAPLGGNTNGSPPVTLVETVPSQILTPIKAPIIVYP